MPNSDFNVLRDHLLDSGVAPRHVVRIILELSDHHEDLELEALQYGCDRETAMAQAKDRLGSPETIATHVLKQPELRCWMHRYPRLAQVVFPVAYVAMLPLAPVYAGVANAPIIARWCTCLFLSSLITAAMFLVMQLSIAFS